MAKDYKDTLNLPGTSFPMKANLAQKEIEMLAFWQDNETYREMQKKDRNKSYILHDGPPYANGNIHLGHSLNKVLKDMIVKYRSMKGFYAPYVPGWDCHGLPIEHQVDKNLGPKKDGTSITEKRRLCREYASKYVDIQREEFKRLGVFGDWTDPYITMAFSYEASIVRELFRFVQNGSVYKGKKPVHWCPTCVTALAEAEVEYADKESPSIYVKFRVVDPLGKFTPDPVLGTFLVIWTTTPWTLPANLALALHPELIYRLVKTPAGELILARDLIKDCMDKFGYNENDYTVTDGAWTGAELEGIACRHPWIEREVRTITGEHVTLEQGTGVVHTAPGHGEEDFEMGLKYGLDVYAPVNSKGCFTEEVEGFSGLHVFKANPEIINKIKLVGALLGSPQNITNSYPHCWRCKRPVIFRATEQWFISMEKNDLRQRALEEINKTEWIPSWGRDRIYGMVSNRPDWCISRQRAWGVPIALFRCKKCREFVTDKTVMDKIEMEFRTNGADIWFEKNEAELLPENYECPKCGFREFSKETDILDVWFDSGVSHAAVMEADQRLTSPADLYLEGSDQHRGWFQSSLLSSVGTRGVAPYKGVLTHGFVVDGQGKKMSKSLGNVISPQEITKKHGAEILRLWTSSADYREDMRISNEIIARLVEAYRKIRNTCRFLLGNINDLDPSEAEPANLKKEDLLEIDRLALSLLQGLIDKVNSAYATFAFHEVYHSIYRFCITDMSAFYLDILKDRLYTFRADSKERRSAQVVLRNILISLTKLIAPILSFTAEEIWLHIPGGRGKSVFLSSFPEVDPLWIDKELEKKWDMLSRIRNDVNKALEIKRQEKLIGNALEAKVTLFAGESFYSLLKEYDNFLPTLFIVSSTEVLKDMTEPENTYQGVEVEGISIQVEKADGSKCQRCWNWDLSVGTSENHPELCRKCREAISA
ncbi:MAG: isoleucine--tRNA ligase [Nitrospirae bacterium]|nr:isoleucine--tRNA ligase [Nitrospirota bacterium]